MKFSRLPLLLLVLPKVVCSRAAAKETRIRRRLTSSGSSSSSSYSSSSSSSSSHRSSSGSESFRNDEPLPRQSSSPSHRSSGGSESFRNDEPLPHQESEVNVLSLLRGRSEALTEFQFVVLEELFVETYNDMAESECSSTNDTPNVLIATIDRSVEHVGTARFGLNFLVTVQGSNSLFYTCPNLTEEAFVLAYNQAIQSGNEDLASSVDSITIAIETEEATPCNEADTFMPSVAITFVGDPTLSTQQQLNVLEELFGETYNVISRFNPVTCDPFFRQVEEATLTEEDGFNRMLVRGRLLQTTATSFSYFFSILGRCRGGCSSSSSLFHHESTRRKLASDATAAWRVLQEERECICPVGATEQRAPTEEEFRNVYQAAISADNRIDSAFIQSVAAASEVDQVECGAALQTFETFLLVELSGQPQSVTQAEVDALDASFDTSFKQLASNFCDPFFRTPIDVVITTTRRRARRILQQGTPFTYQYAIQAQCRGCGENARLFSQSVTRMLSRTAAGGEFTSNHGRQTQQDGLCFCNVESVDNRSPTTDEFQVAYNDTVSELNLPNVDQILDVIELAEEPGVGSKSVKADGQLESPSKSHQVRGSGSGRVYTHKTKASKSRYIGRISKAKGGKSGKSARYSKTKGRFHA